VRVGVRGRAAVVGPIAAQTAHYRFWALADAAALVLVLTH